jgi:DNA sulfur modification protein DndB
VETPADLTKAAANKIVVLRDEEIDYFKKLTGLLKAAAKYQLLAHVFSEEKIHEIDIRVPATKGRMGKQTFYNFLIRPFDLLKIAYISHKKSRSVKDAETYQRMVTPKRLKAIAKYIDTGGQFPTNIVINIKSKQELVFDKKDVIGESSFGILHLPSRYASAWVIDGQHRLYGYAYSKRIAKRDIDKTTFPVLAYENLPPMEEAGLFVDINSKQERVKQNLIKEIYADLKWESKDFKEKLDALRSRTAIKLNSTIDSPLYERFALASKSKSSTTCLTLSSFADGLRENKFFGDQTTTIFKPGPLYASYDGDMDESLEKATKVLTYYFRLCQKAIPDHWALGDGPGGYLCTNNGIRSLLIVLRAILTCIKDEIKIDLDDLPSESIVGRLDKFVDPLMQFFSIASAETIKHFRKRQAIKGVNDNAVELMAKIHEQVKEFCPDKLKDYLDTIDVLGTEDAKKLMGEIQISMFKFVTDKLKEQFGEDGWWFGGIPEKVRLNCSEKHQKEKGVKKVEQYIHLLDYQAIAKANWSIFEKPFSMTKQGDRDRKLKWISDLNMVRNITHHEEKWPATKDQVAFVREVHGFVKKNFV